MTLLLLSIVTSALAGAPDDVVAAAAAEGLPTTALEAKAAEGRAKGVDDARIASVLQDMAERLARAKGLLGPLDEATLIAGGRALGAGASEAAVGQVATEAGGDSAKALDGLADLMSNGFAEEPASKLVRRAIRSNRPEEALATLAPAALALLAGGQDHILTASTLEATLAKGQPPLAAVRGGPPPWANGNAYGLDNRERTL